MIAKVGDRVRVRYTRMQNASSMPSVAPKPRVLEFTVGGDHELPGLSQCVLGMRQGEQKCVTLQPAEAFGAVKPRLIREISRRFIRTKSILKLGMLLIPSKSRADQGRTYRVVELKRDSVIVDGNHPGAGRDLSLAVFLVSVDSSSEANQSKPQFDNGGES